MTMVTANGVSLTIGDLIALAAVCVSIAPCIYHIGKLTARIESLEKWRTEIRETLTEISQDVKTISARIVRGPGAGV